MKVSKLVLAASIAGVIGIASLTSTAFAWHPKGIITKKVQNVTTGSALSDADTAAAAVVAKPGDTLKYVIEVSNIGAADDKGYNDMAKTVMTDTLPDGIELVANPSQRQISENLGTIKPGKSVVKEYTVKVTAKTAGAIENTACFTGNSTANDNPQQGCNPAVVTVTIPEVPVTTTPETPETPKTPVTPAKEMPAELPHTGLAENVIFSSFALGLIVYVAYIYVNSRRTLAKQLN